MGYGRCRVCGNRGPNGGRPCRCAPLPPPAAAPRPPVPQPLGSRLPAPRAPALRHPPSPPSTPFHSPGDEAHILFGLGRKDETTQATSNPSRLLSTEPGQVQGAPDSPTGFRKPCP